MGVPFKVISMIKALYIYRNESKFESNVVTNVEIENRNQVYIIKIQITFNFPENMQWPSE